MSQGAAFGAALGIIAFGGGAVEAGGDYAVQIDNPYIVTLCAFICGSASTAVILAISRVRRELGPGALVLAGVALSSLFTGGQHAPAIFCGRHEAGAVVFWTFGDLGGTNWGELALLGLTAAAALCYFLAKRWDYNAISAGSDTAASLGVNVRAVTLVSMAVCTVASALAVSFVGIISFIGLVAPHAMRRFVGEDYRWLLPCSAAGGALLLLLADLLCRVVIAPVILPVGAVTSFLGAPVFLYLLLKGGRAPCLRLRISASATRRGARCSMAWALRPRRARPSPCWATTARGKSTLIKCMDRILTPSGGEVLLDGQNLSPSRAAKHARLCAYVPQARPRARQTVFDAVLLGRRPYISWDATAHDKAVAASALELMGARRLRAPAHGRALRRRTAEGGHSPGPGAGTAGAAAGRANQLPRPARPA